MKINVENVIKMLKFRQMINSVDLSEIEWYLNGKKELIASEDLDNFNFIGLSNTEFVPFYFGDEVESAGLQSLGISILIGNKISDEE